jgi:hypothetical protein
MEAARTSETSVDNYFTRQYIPGDNSAQYKNIFTNKSVFNITNNITYPKMIFLCDVASCSLVEIDRHFRVTQSTAAFIRAMIPDD